MAYNAAIAADAMRFSPHNRESDVLGQYDMNDSDNQPIVSEKVGKHFVETSDTTSNDDSPKEIRTTEDAALMYTEDGQLVLLPSRTNDPRDPLNLPTWHKLVGLFCTCCFGALAAAAELILGAMLPVFALQYAGIDPKVLGLMTEHGGFPAGSDPLAVLANLPHAPPLWETYLLATMPVLMMGLANLFLIPVAIAIGRRPVLLGCGVTAVIGACWAGVSNSLVAHITARCLQALGAGTVESLIPFILQDTVFYHQRNTAVSGVFAAQGAIIIAIGVSAPYCILNLSWRWIYFITAGGAAFFLIGVYFFMPETRYIRSTDELSGIPRRDEDTSKEPRTLAYNLSLQSGPVDWAAGRNALLDTFRTFFYPQILFITLLNSVTIAQTFAAAYTVSPALLTAPYAWKFTNIGFCLVPIMIAGALCAIVTGKGADIVANRFAKIRGRRLPENQLLNLILPAICAVVGSVVFGVAGANPEKYPWPVFLLGLGLIGFGFLGTNTVGAVYVLECYPRLAGPSLVNIASFRCLIAFIFSFKISDLIISLGYEDSMFMYTGLISLFGLMIPVIYVFGPGWRRRWPGPDR